MASNKTVPLHWAEKLRFNVYQAKLSAATGNFSYFHASRAQYIANGVDYAATFQVENNDTAEVTKINEINAASAETNKKAMAKLENELKDTKVDKSLPRAEQEREWEKRIRGTNEAAKQMVIDRMDSATNQAVNLIQQMPEKSQDSAADIYDRGLQIVLECFEYLVKKIEELYDNILEFIKEVWSTIVSAYNAVKDWVSSAVDRIMGSFDGFSALAQTNGIVDVDGECDLNL